MKNLINQIRDINYIKANFIIQQISGIVNYFLSDDEKYEFISVHDRGAFSVSEDRASYGDWQAG